MEKNHKSDFRKSCIKKIESISFCTKYYKNKIIVKKIDKFIKDSKARNILLYIPLGMEVDVRPLINNLRKYRKNVYVPFMHLESFKIVKYRLPLHKKRFGIKEPNNSFLKPKKIDVAIVPIVGVDVLNKRIGYGKGMYDRFFDKLNYKPTIVFTQLVLCKSNSILSDNYDIKADYIITS
ncbi:5-formyltetrahydrofolate cyclo-ligase [Aliarcobacter butzleri L355]|uniref:5-formyltetrahydrofolate cyclo-ligase n=1 Tax=Aliarcobacter butzleri L355 TaxID=1447263 RepID=A0A0G9KRS6_9BACT|nr:5-formyltetrahydrofolate cyclo-ligase [Aliarcobacter butzleri]KLE09141.1 5-formyltetrahydrofolate cyclo-ligase [Aliarcobacter butzleri L355]